MITSTGKSVWPSDSEYYEPGTAPAIEDIAIGLARMPRFAGQTRDYYTVLMHTFVVSELVSDQARIYALLHDAPEAIVADVPTPWKTTAAKDREEELLQRICAQQEVLWPPPLDLWDEVVEADALALAAEAHVLGHPEAEKWWPIGKWTAPHYEAESKTRAYLGAAHRLVEQTDVAIDLYANRIDTAKRLMRSDAHAPA